MIKKILWFLGVAVIMSLALFAGVIADIAELVSWFLPIISLIPLEMRVAFFAAFLALMWALYNVFAT